MAIPKISTCTVGWCNNEAVAADRCSDHFQDFALRAERSVVALYAMLATTPVNAVKLGISADPEARRDQLQLSCPVKLALMGSIPGSATLEKAVHNLLSDCAIGREWFRYDGDAKRIADAIATGSLREFEVVLDSL